ncbi:MAG: hypothetical protein P8Y35_06910 [Sulfurovaceae bacterium]|jgi:putative transposase
MPKRRKATHHTADYWQAHITACSESPLTCEQYCQKHHLTTSTFYNWKKKLQTRQHDGSESLAVSSLLELPSDLLVTEPVSNKHGSGSWDIELSLGHGVILRMRQL